MVKHVPGLLAFALVLLFPLRQFYPALLLLALCLLAYMLGLSGILTGSRHKAYDALIVLAMLLAAGPAAAQIVGERAAYVAFLSGTLMLLLLSFFLTRSVSRKSAVGALAPGRGTRIVWCFVLLLLFAAAAFIPAADAALGSRFAAWLALSLALLFLLSYGLSSLKRWAAEFGEGFRDLFVHRGTFLLGVAGFLVAHYTLFMAASVRIRPTLPSLGLVVLAVLPAYIWFKVFRVREDDVHLPDWPGWLTSLVLAAIAPVVVAFPLRFLPGPALVVQSHADSLATVSAFLGVFVLFLAMSMMDEYLRRALMMGPFLAAVILLGVYSYHAFIGMFFRATILAFALRGWAAAALPAVIVLFIVQSLFYVTGYLSFLYEMWRE